MDDPVENLATISRRVDLAEAAAAKAGLPGGKVCLLAVSKTRNAAEIRVLAACGQRAFGENYVQETLDKQRALTDLSLEWHLIGHLQSNKAPEAALAFDWVQTVDRIKLVTALARHRPVGRDPMNVLIQVNIDGEASKSGCRREEVAELAHAIASEPRLVLRGLMAIPAPDPDMQRRRTAFRQMKQLFDATAAKHSRMDTLSMGMSEDFELAIAEGATLVRVGTLMFGARLALG